MGGGEGGCAYACCCRYIWREGDGRVTKNARQRDLHHHKGQGQIPFESAAACGACESCASMVLEHM